MSCAWCALFVYVSYEVWMTYPLDTVHNVFLIQILQSCVVPVPLSLKLFIILSISHTLSIHGMITVSILMDPKRYSPLPKIVTLSIPSFHPSVVFALYTDTPCHVQITLECTLSCMMYVHVVAQIHSQISLQVADLNKESQLDYVPQLIELHCYKHIDSALQTVM